MHVGKAIAARGLDNIPDLGELTHRSHVSTASSASCGVVAILRGLGSIATAMRAVEDLSSVQHH
jgi:hypothetical protein